MEPRCGRTGLLAILGSMDIHHTHDVSELYAKYRRRLLDLLNTAFRHSLSEQDVEDVVQDLFVELLMRGTRIVGAQTWSSLVIYATQDAQDFLRRRKTLKRGKGNISSLDTLLEQGCDFAENGDSTAFLESVEIVDLAIAAAIPYLSERERILLHHIRRVATFSEPSLADLASMLTPDERERFLPVRDTVATWDADTFVIRQVGRSRSNLWRRLAVARNTLSA